EEGLDRADAEQILGRAHADLTQPCRRFRTYVADLRILAAHAAASVCAEGESDSRNTAHSACMPRASSASNRPGSGLSTSQTPSKASPMNKGTTTSEREAASQAMCPGKALTSATTWVSRVVAAVPQTPRPSAMRTQAGLPWNGPTTSSRPSKK